MQTHEKPALNGTVSRLPPQGPNKIMQAIEDYDHMAVELEHTKRELQEYIALANKLQAENDAVRQQLSVQTEFLTRQVDLATTRADILGTTLTALRTNYSTIRETFARCEAEALTAGLAAAEVPVERPAPPPEEEKPTTPELRALIDLALEGRGPRTPLEPNKL